MQVILTSPAGRRVPGITTMDTVLCRLSGVTHCLSPAGTMRGSETRQMACKSRLNAAPRTGPGARNKVVAPCAKHSSESTKPRQGRRSQQKSAKSTRHKSSASKTVTPPMKVEVEAQLAKLEQAANPWWSTFCGITNGVWLGETAAFAPSTGEQPCFPRSNAA